MKPSAVSIQQATRDVYMSIRGKVTDVVVSCNKFETMDLSQAYMATLDELYTFRVNTHASHAW